MTTSGPTRRIMTIRYYIVAMLFLVFDIEIIFLYPWAVISRRLGLFGFIEMLVFVFILFIGYIYIWKKGALEWE
jgi:NADH-quinone oxidoreductase subunit A